MLRSTRSKTLLRLSTASWSLGSGVDPMAGGWRLLKSESNAALGLAFGVTGTMLPVLSFRADMVPWGGLSPVPVKYCDA